MLKAKDNPVDGISRRAFLASLSAAIAAGKSAQAVPLPTPVADGGKAISLYVHHECDGLLSFGSRYDDFLNPPDWTWREFVAYEHAFDPRTELNESALSYAREYFKDWTGVDLDDETGDFGEYATREEARAAFAKWLDSPHPDNDDLDGPAWAWYDQHEAPTAQAYELLKLLGLAPEEASNGYGESDGIITDRLTFLTARVDDQGLERIRSAVQKLGLRLEIIETH